MEADGEFVVAGGDGPELLAAVDQPLDAFPFPVGGAVEAHAAARLVAQARDHRADPAPPQVAPDLPSGVALVARHPRRPDADPAARPPHRAALQQRLDPGRLLALAAGQHPRDGLPRRSARRWSLVEKPPLLLPNAWSPPPFSPPPRAGAPGSPCRPGRAATNRGRHGRRRRPGAPPAPGPRPRPVATAGTGNAPSATCRTARAGRATGRRCAPARGS